MKGIKKGNTVLSPFDTYESGFKPGLNRPDEVFAASKIAGAEDMEKREEISQQLPQAVTLPNNYFMPVDSQSIDIRNLANVPPGLTVTLMSFRAPPGNIVRFISYSIFFDALMFDLVNMVPLVNGSRVFPYHGNPNRNYKMGLGLGPDMSNNNLIPCQLELQPRDLLEWVFTNNDTVDVAAGVRMSGYVDQSTIRKMGRSGG